MARRVLRTKLCDMLGIEYPIIAAGMGPTLIGETTGAPVDLVVAVSEAGGMGVLGGSGFSEESLRDAIREIKAKTKKPYGVDLLLPQKLDVGGGLGQKGPKELPLSAILKAMPQSHQDWVKKVKDELQLPDVEIIVKMNTTTMRPKEAIQVCIDEKVPLFCAGLGNPGFMAAEAHAAGMKVLGITGNAKNARRMAQSGIDLLVAQGPAPGAAGDCRAAGRADDGGRSSPCRVGARSGGGARGGAVVVAGYTNGYAGYVTTDEEYQLQLYEGASTLHGRWSLAGYQTHLDTLVGRLRDRPGDRDADPGPAIRRPRAAEIYAQTWDPGH